ncbi:MAG: TonB-dependent receptor [Bacteroidetes bacterium]|nr:TonB-dependent receptor [Bacteroidota bacterium]MBL0030860.1 TonB-dependent receptor [Bacteroidota bacterium]MBP6427982.1 TonB-dependent receptor [Bacteroidia bacterium]MBP6656975.1 TonB-dependent receptor [Bacteroidia bacterium]
MKIISHILFLQFVATFCSTTLKAQTLTQTIRGTITDQISQATLPGASVVLMNSSPVNGTATDLNGNFKLTDVPVGMQSLKISFMGYKEFILPNINVTSGKEVVLSVSLEENIVMGKEVVITAEIQKDKPLNEFTMVSGRTFSVEETQKYAAAVNDPARMSTAFAGVISTDDGNNNIAIRGNAPNSLQWRMEGVEIPNPNHFSLEGTSGGGISILSSQVLTNSDFLTGAFAAEYGNALSGVFDLKLRKGNDQKTEYTLQAGLLGTDFAIEGPFKKDYNGSYLINYRYSTLAMISALGVSIGDAVTTFQDLSFNVFLPTKRSGNFSIWGFGGLSNQVSDAKKDSTEWETNFDRYSWNYKYNTGAVGLSHFIMLDDKSYLKSTLITSGTDRGGEQSILDSEYSEIPEGNESYDQNKVALNTIYTRKINAKNSIKAGIIASMNFYDLEQSWRNESGTSIETLIKQNGEAITLQSFAQWNFHPLERLTIVTGLHYLAFTENNTFSIEPRASAKYNLNDKQSVSIGYGLHGQVQPLGVYFAQLNNSDGTIVMPNHDLGISKSHHFVVGYDRTITKYMHVKIEGYYQSIFNVPVNADASKTFSMLNNEYGFVTDPLVNKGKGVNKGIELTIEQYLHNDFYFLLSSSFYDSKYQTLSGKWFNTRFNGQYATTFTGGKDFKTGPGFGNRIVGINIKTIVAGGLRNTPIDYNASVAAGETKYIESESYSLKAKDYFRTDVKISVKRNRKKSTVTWSLDVQNATSNKNVAGEYFDPLTSTTKISYQTPLIPILAYRVEF